MIKADGFFPFCLPSASSLLAAKPAGSSGRRAVNAGPRPRPWNDSARWPPEVLWPGEPTDELRAGRTRLDQVGYVAGLLGKGGTFGDLDLV